MAMHEVDGLREPIIAIAREAAAAILAVYDGVFEVEHKTDASPLTAADLAAHRCIAAGLERLTPGIPVLSEESAEVGPSVRHGWSQLWLVDPLDGTREFVKRNDEFTVNIALIDAGVPVLAVVQAPVTGTVWYAQREGGAFRRDGSRTWNGSCGEDRDRRLHTRRPAIAPLRVAASRSHRDPRSQALMARIGAIESVVLGSSLKFCKLAEGDVDVYPRFGATSEWDTAAGQCVLEAAGGCVIDPRGRPLRYNQRDTLLNGDFLALGDPQLPWRDWVSGRAEQMP